MATTSMGVDDADPGVAGDGAASRRGMALAHQMVHRILSVESARSTAPPRARTPATNSSKFWSSCAVKVSPWFSRLPTRAASHLGKRHRKAPTPSGLNGNALARPRVLDVRPEGVALLFYRRSALNSASVHLIVCAHASVGIGTSVNKPASSTAEAQRKHDTLKGVGRLGWRARITGKTVWHAAQMHSYRAPATSTYRTAFPCIEAAQMAQCPVVGMSASAACCRQYGRSPRTAATGPRMPHSEHGQTTSYCPPRDCAYATIPVMSTVTTASEPHPEHTRHPSSASTVKMRRVLPRFPTGARMDRHMVQTGTGSSPNRSR